MIRIRTAAGVFVALPAVAGCPGFGDQLPGSQVDVVADVPTYEGDVKLVLDAYCVSCHTSPPQGSAPDYFRLDVYESVDGVAGAYDMSGRIVARATGAGASMPPAGNPAPTEIEQDVLIRWEELGAPQDEGDVDTGGAR